jgi:membrane protein YdfJ
MAKLLYKLGQWALNHRKKVVFSTLGILIALVVLVMNIGYSFNEDMSIPNTPADKAATVISEEFEGAGNQGATAQIVFKAPENETLESPELQQAILDTLNEIKQDPDVASVAAPMELMNITQDKKIGYAQVTFYVKAEQVTEDSINNILEHIEITRDAGIQTEVRGDNLTFSETGSLHTAEIAGVVIAFFILAVTFVSFTAAGLPIITAAIGLGLGLIAIVLGTNFIEFQSVSMSLAAMLGLAVGIDYALFIMTRFKQQISKGFSVQESVAIANGTAGSAVVFAGITVIIGLLGLSVTGIPFLTMMGISAAISILSAVLVSIIVLPAILGMIGHKVGPAKENNFLKKITGSKNKQTGSNKWGEFVTKHPLVVSIVGIALLVTIALPMFHMNLGLPSDGTTKSTEQTERKAFDLLTEAYGEGFNALLVVAAKAEEANNEPPQAINEITQELSELSGVQMVTPPVPGPSGELYVMTVIPETGPDDAETKEIVKTIRD